MCKSLSILCSLVIFVFITFNLLSPVYATETTTESEHFFDYELDFGRKYTVVEELLGKVTYEVCCCDVLKDAALTAQGYPHSFSIDSVDALTQYLETAGGGEALDFTVRTEQYPNSFLDITARYDDAFFADNFLAISQMPMREGDAFRVERIDHVSGNGNTICIVTDFEQYKCDRKVYYLIIPLPRAYYGGPQSVTASHIDWVTFAEESPKTADSFVILPAAAAMVLAAAGLVWVRKRRAP